MKTSLLIISFFLTIVCHAQNKIESSIYEYYNGTVWENSSGTNYTYDNNNNLLSATFYDWNTNSWSESFKENYTYNANNLVIELAVEMWNGSQFENQYKNLYTYDSNNNVIEFISQDWTGTQWQNSFRITVTYNTNGTIDIFNDYYWSGSNWINSERATHSYTNGNLTLALIEEWTGSQWQNSDRQTYNYDTNGNKILYKIETWTGSQWVEEERETFTIDSNGNRTRVVINYNGGQIKTEYSYDMTALLSSYGHPFKDRTGLDYFYQDLPYINKILNEVEYNYDSTTSTYTQSGRTTYDYNNPLTLSNEDLNTIQTINLYPNPANNFISLNGLDHKELISIYNTTGIKVLEQEVDNEITIDIQQLSSGLYFLTFENGNTIKFLKE